MRFYSSLLFVYFLVSLGLSTRWQGDYSKQFESLSAIPRGWSQVKCAPPSMTVKFFFAVKSLHMSQFEDHAMNIATPGHPLYGKHMSKEDVASFLQPNVEAMVAVESWLHKSGATTNRVNEHGGWVIGQMNVSLAESLFDTTFHEYRSVETSIVRTLQYSLPTSLHEYVHMVQPTTQFGNPKPLHDTVTKGAGLSLPVNTTSFEVSRCNETVTPACLRCQYQLDNFTAIHHSRNRFGISGYLGQYARYSDLALFSSTFAPSAPLTNFTVKSINGGQNLQNSTDNSLEASVDIQYGIALAPNTSTVYYSTAGLGPLVPDLDQPTFELNSNEPYLNQVFHLLQLPDDELPTVLSTSYGEDEQSLPPVFANLTCHLYAQLGARGVSVIFASGDSGPGDGCQSNDGRNTTRFMPQFPASCPFVTSVGGTHNLVPEQAVSFSSGGFSEYFARPLYQENAVRVYLDKLGDRWNGLYNSQGRGFPDVAARSRNFYVYDHGLLTSISGTSASAPVFAAIIVNLNSLRMNAGLPPLGFLNPFLYMYGTAGLTDITRGGSRGCLGYDIQSGLPAPYVPYASWNATEGWDPVTGLGTPVFPKLVEAMFRYAVPEDTGTGSTTSNMSTTAARMRE